MRPFCTKTTAVCTDRLFGVWTAFEPCVWCNVADLCENGSALCAVQPGNTIVNNKPTTSQTRQGITILNWLLFINYNGKYIVCSQFSPFTNYTVKMINTQSCCSTSLINMTLLLPCVYNVEMVQIWLLTSHAKINAVAYQLGRSLIICH